MGGIHKCDLYILSAVTDLAFLEYTIPHQVKNCRVPNGIRNLVVDTAKISGYYSKNREINALDQLLEIANCLKNDGMIDQIIPIAYKTKEKREAYKRHFGFNFRESHCFRGYPYWGSILPLEHTSAEYVAHLDSDMLIYESPNFNWIEESIRLMEENPEIACVLPLSGPPDKKQVLHQGPNDYHYNHKMKAYLFKAFTSRVFVMHKERFMSLCPMKIKWLSWREPIYSILLGKGKMLCWEATVSNALENSDLWRADLASHKSWSLHPTERGRNFNRLLPEIIASVEKGQFPIEQSGHYDLCLDYWEKFINESK